MMESNSLVVDGKKISEDDEEGNKIAGEWVRNQYNTSLKLLRTGYYQTAVDGPVPRFLWLTQQAPVPGCTITGRTGSGKSTQLTHLLVQEAHKGNGFYLMDSVTCETAFNLLKTIPEDRISDVIWIDTTITGRISTLMGTKEKKFGYFNPLYVDSDEYKTTFARNISEEITNMIVAVLLDEEWYNKKDYEYLYDILFPMIDSEYDYNLYDLYEILNETQEGKRISNQITQIPQYVLDKVWNNNSNLHRVSFTISNLLAGNFEKMTTRRGYTFDIRKAVEDDKIIIVAGSSNSELSKTRTKLIGASLLRQLKAYLTQLESASSPYLAGIEWTNYFLDNSGEIFSRIFDDSESGLFPFFVFQLPSQIPDSCREELLNYTTYNITFSMGNTLLKETQPNIDRTGAEDISEAFNVDDDIIPELSGYKFIMRGYGEDPDYGYAFAPLPPERSLESILPVLEKTLREYTVCDIIQ